MPNRRAIVVSILVGAFIGALMVVSRKLEALCVDGAVQCSFVSDPETLPPLFGRPRQNKNVPPFLPPVLSPASKPSDGKGSSGKRKQDQGILPPPSAPKPRSGKSSSRKQKQVKNASPPTPNLSTGRSSSGRQRQYEGVTPPPPASNSNAGRSSSREQKQANTSPSPSADPKPNTGTEFREKQKQLKDAPPPPAAKPDTAVGNPRQADPACDGFPDTSNILVVMKTGASEAYSKLPTQLLTNLRCVPDFLFFSDMAEVIAGHPVHDSLDAIPDEVKADNHDFDLYFEQQRCAADRESCNQNRPITGRAWALDRYKNVHVAEKAYRLRPGFDWYLFVDADSYVLWPTLTQWLRRLDPSERLYLGSPATIRGVEFAHGGSGYILSRAAMRDFFQGKEGVANKWNDAPKIICCGDFIFALALLKETGVRVNGSWPTINGEKPYSLGFGAEQWCQPIATMHHLSAEEISDFDAFERERGFAGPMRFKDIYYRFVANLMTEPQRADWDNVSANVYLYNEAAQRKPEPGPAWEPGPAKKGPLTALETQAHMSLEGCRRACEGNGRCVQYMYHSRRVCALGHLVTHGAPRRDRSGKETWTSGWILDRIKRRVGKHDECGEVVWPGA